MYNTNGKETAGEDHEQYRRIDMMWLVLFLFGALVAGYFLRPAIERFLDFHQRDAESGRRVGEEKAFTEGKKKGYSEALEVLVETDENAAIIEAIGNNTLGCHGVKPLNTEEAIRAAIIQVQINSQMAWMLYGGVYLERGWTWTNKKLTRAGLKATAPTPRGAYRSFLAQREAADAICAQLDELERVRKEQGTP